MRMICFSDKGILNRRLPAPRKRFALFAIFLQIIMFLISSISLGLRLSGLLRGINYKNGEQRCSQGD